MLSEVERENDRREAAVPGYQEPLQILLVRFFNEKPLIRQADHLSSGRRAHSTGLSHSVMAFISGGGASKQLVVLVHGFMGARAQLLPMAASLVRRYEILNLAYRSRQDTLAGHAKSLVDNLSLRLERDRNVVHFVTHSFGGLVVNKAFSHGLQELLGDDRRQSRCVLIGPPLRGAAFARAFQRENIAGPEMVRDALHMTASTVLGEYCGKELMMNDERWFDENIGTIPEDIEVLVVAGSYGRLNPLIDGDSDGVVGVEETKLKRKHFRLEVGSTHNLLLYTPAVIESVSTFLQGGEVGELVR